MLAVNQRDIDRWYESCCSFEWNGNDIACRDYGSGDPMLLIHGFPTSGSDWADIGESIREHFRLVVPDLLDYGRSRNPAKRTWHIHDQADMIESLIGKLGISACEVVAHDVGDTVAQELLARHAAGSLGFRINSLILMNGGIFPQHHRARKIQKLLLSPIGPLIAALIRKDRFMASLAPLFGPDTQPSADNVDALWEIALSVNGKQSFARRIQYMQDRLDNEARWVGALRNTGVRMMMINGLTDPVSGGHVCDVLEQEIPQMKVVRLENIGHFPLLEAPADCAKHILHFHGLGEE